MTNKLRTSGAPELAIEYIDRTQLVPDPRNSRVHNKGQLVRLQAAIEEFGFNAPVIIDESSHVIAGHARLIVAEKLGMYGLCNCGLRANVSTYHARRMIRCAPWRDWKEDLVAIARSDLWQAHPDRHSSGTRQRSHLARPSRRFTQRTEEDLVVSRGHVPIGRKYELQ